GVQTCALPICRQQGAARGLEVERKRRIVLDVDEPLGLADVRANERVDQRRYLLVRKGLLPANQCDAGGEPLQIPGEVSDERLVEVVDVEDEHSGPVHIRAEVL